MSNENKGAAAPKDDVAELKAMVLTMGQQLQELAARNQDLEAANEVILSGGVLPDDEQPRWEVINCQGYWSPDCVYWVEGSQFTDITGTIPPCENFLPLNRAAEERMDAWLKALPGQVKTPPIEFILESAMQLRDMNVERPEFYSAVLHRAIDLATSQGAKIDIGRQVTRPVKQSNVPLTTHGRFNGKEIAPPRGATRHYGNAPVPANKDVDAMTSRSELIGGNGGRFNHSAVR